MTYLDLFNKISIHDIHEYLTTLSSSIGSYQSSNDALSKFFESITPKSERELELMRFLCIYNEEISIFDESIDNALYVFESKLDKYLSGTPMKEYKLISKLPIIKISVEHEGSYSNIDNLSEEITRIYSNFSTLVDELEKLTDDDIRSVYNYFLRVNGKPAGVELKSSSLSCLSELLNSKEHNYYKQFHEFLDVLSYGTINY